MEKIVLYFAQESDYHIAVERVRAFGIPLQALSPYLIMYHGTVDESLFSDAVRLSHPIAQSVLESMANNGVKAAARAMVAPRDKQAPNQGVVWDAKGFDAPGKK